MNILMLSTDRRIFEHGSDVRERMAGYGTVFDTLNIIVLGSDGAGVHHPDALSHNVFAYRTSRSPFLSLFRAYRIAARILGGGRDWVITAQDPFAIGLLGALLAWRRSSPFHVQVHTDFLSSRFIRESLRNRVYCRIARFVLRRAKRVRVVSSRIGQSLLNRFPYLAGRIDTLPIFVDMQEKGGGVSRREMRARYPRHDFIVLMASRLTKEKNIGMALEAMCGVVEKNPKALLFIVGEGPEHTAIASRITQLHLENNAIIEPWTSDLGPYYRAADAYLLTSNYEGYSRTAVEAMAAGIPVVMTDVGIAGELVKDGETGIVVPVGDAAALHTALSSLERDPVRREQLGAKGREAVRHFGTKDAYLKNYRATLEAAFRERKKPKLCYVMPECDPLSHTHMSYLGTFVREISQAFDIFLIIERGGVPQDNLGCRVAYSADSHTRGIRFIKVGAALLTARLRGYRTFYVHYSFFAAYAASWIARLTGGRVLYWNCGEPWKYGRSRQREWLERRVYRAIDALVTGTEGLRGHYSVHYGIPISRIQLMSNWIDFEEFSGQISKTSVQSMRARLGIPRAAKVILFVHRLSKRKGAHYLSEIMRKIGDANAVLLIAGEGPERKHIEADIEKFGLQNTIFLLGSIPHSELPHYYGLADVFLMPSDEEGFPHVLLEAMAAGIPVAATRVGSVEESMPPGLTPYLSDQGNIEHMTQATRCLLALSTKERHALQREMAQWVTRYNLGTAVQQFRAIIFP